MAINSYIVGPGTLTFGAVGSEQQIAAQVTACKVVPSVDAEDDVPVLSGEVLPGDETETFALEFTCFQDISLTGIVQWTWDNAGEVHPFSFIPNTVEDRVIAGQIKVRRLEVGGEVKKRATSEAEFPIVGTPTIGDATI